MRKLSDDAKARRRLRAELLGVLVATALLGTVLALAAMSACGVDLDAGNGNTVPSSKACRVTRVIDAIVSNVRDLAT
jgi:hypothetical protein